jgi:hypothetical protein
LILLLLLLLLILLLLLLLRKYLSLEAYCATYRYLVLCLWIIP